jgi:multidrug efflux pump subunit AcrA (membrane-fusion protein)
VEQAASLKPGDQAFASDPAAPDSTLPLVLEGLSAHARNGLLQAARFRLITPDIALPTGMSLTVQLTSRARPGLSIPAQALLLGDARLPQVFVYDAAAGKVILRNIQIGLIDQGRVGVDGGLKEGEQVVVSGVAFLNDDQDVAVVVPSSRLSTDQ